jgi:V8-like Glu-specific endopeptidase
MAHRYIVDLQVAADCRRHETSVMFVYQRAVRDMAVLPIVWMTSKRTTIAGLTSFVLVWFSTTVQADVFGSDDRIAVPASLASAARGVGLVTNGRTKSVCSMFCVASAVVATAAHCLDVGGDGGASRLVHVRLSVPPHAAGDTTTIAGVRISSAAQHVTTGQITAASMKSRSAAADDWALIRLERPICAGRVLALDRVAAASDRQVSHVAYHSDRGLAAAAVVDCRLWRSDDAGPLLLHDCDTGGASSGSPILVVKPTELRVVAINIGVYRRSRVVMGTTPAVVGDKDRPVANAAVAVESIADRLAAFDGATIVSDGLLMTRLQRALAAGGWYRSSINGAYSQAVGAAIARYEASTDRLVTGLPTSDLLRAIERKTP